MFYSEEQSHWEESQNELLSKETIEKVWNTHCGLKVIFNLFKTLSI